MNIRKLEGTRLLEILRTAEYTDGQIELMSPAEAIANALNYEGIIDQSEWITDAIDDARAAENEDNVSHRFLVQAILGTTRNDLVQSLMRIAQSFDDDSDAEKMREFVGGASNEELIVELIDQCSDFEGFDPEWTTKLEVMAID